MPSEIQVSERVPSSIGTLLTQLQGTCQVVQVVPKMIDGKQKRNREGVPVWWVRLLYTSSDGETVDIVKANYSSEEDPNDLVGKKSEKSLMLGALFYRMSSGREGWSYNLDGGLIRQFK